ncbi:DNA-binding transcriptional regulator [Planctomycetes bacterium Pan216]
MKRRRGVALLIETSNAYARGLLEGIVAYIREHDEWSVHLPEQERGARPPDWLRNWRGDGIIARIESEAIANAVATTRLPFVDVSAARRLPGYPWVETDDAAIAKLAANHLLERGFQHLAYCGESPFNWSRWREEHFVEIANRAVGACATFEAKSRFAPGYSWNRERSRLRRWIERLPKPIGVMACYDIRAQQLLDVCRESNIAVPEEVAVIGVDDDQLLCDLCSPSLSSVIPDALGTGYEAARLLDRLMSAEEVEPDAHLVAPLGVATRRSTDILAIDDPDIAKALRYIREHACDGINVNDLTRVLPLSRRVLESRFQQLLGRTPHETIVEQRIDRVRQLLRETELPLAVIAERSGFRHVEYMSTLFRRRVGVPPSHFRRQAKDRRS